MSDITKSPSTGTSICNDNAERHKGLTHENPLEIKNWPSKNAFEMSKLEFKISTRRILRASARPRGQLSGYNLTWG